MPPKKAKKVTKKPKSYTIRPHPMTGRGVKVDNKTGRMWHYDPITGKGFLGDLWNGAKKVFNWAKDNKVISTVAGMIPHPVAQRIGAAAGSVGMGRRPIVPFLGSPMVR